MKCFLQKAPILLFISLSRPTFEVTSVSTSIYPRQFYLFRSNIQAVFKRTCFWKPISVSYKYRCLNEIFICRSVERTSAIIYLFEMFFSKYPLISWMQILSAVLSYSEISRSFRSYRLSFLKILELEFQAKCPRLSERPHESVCKLFTCVILTINRC